MIIAEAVAKLSNEIKLGVKFLTCKPSAMMWNLNGTQSEIGRTCPRFFR